MGQRELKVKVTGKIDSKFEKFINSLKKTIHVSVKVDVKNGELNNLKKTLDGISKRKIAPKIAPEVDNRGLAGVKKRLDNLDKRKITPTVEVKTNSNGLDEVQAQADKINNTRISPIGVATGLAPLAITLDQISDKILNIASQKITPIIEGTFSDAGDLYDVQTSFQKQFDLDGRSAKDIKSWMQDIGNYAQKSIYDTGELLSLFSNLEGAHFDDSMGTVKALAGISSMAPNASKALGLVSTQVKQFNKNGNVYSADWKSIREAIQGVAAGKLNEWFVKNKGFELITENFKEGKVTVQDFLQAIREVGGSDMFQGLAQNTDTLSGSMAQLKESLRNVLLGDQYNPGPIRDLFNNIVKWTNDFADEIPRLSKKVGKGLDYFNDVIKESFGDFTVKDFFSSLGDSLKTIQPFIGGFIKLIGAITNKGKNVGGVLGSLLKFAIGWKVFRGVAQPVLSLATAIVTFKKATKGLNVKNPFGKGGLSSIFGRGSTRKLNVSQITTSALNTAKNLATVAGVIGEVWLASKAIENIGNMDIDFDNVIQNLSKVSGSVTLAGAYVTAIGFALDKWKGFKKNLTTGTVAVAGVSGALRIVTQAIASVSNTKIDGDKLLNNLGTLAGVVAGAGLAFTGIGLAMATFPQASAMLATGAVASVGISVALALVAKGMVSTVDSMNELSDGLLELEKVDVAAVSRGIDKLSWLALSLGGFSLISIPTGVAGAIGGTIGAIGNIMTNVNLSTFESSIKKVSSLTTTLGKLKNIDKKTLNESLKKLNDVWDFLGNFSGVSVFTGLAGTIGGVIGSIGNFVTGVNLSTLENSINGVSKLSKTLNNFRKIKVAKDDAGIVREKVDNIFYVLENLADTVAKYNAKSGKVIADFTVISANIGSITSAFDNVAGFVKKMSAYQIDKKKADEAIEKIKKIKNVISDLRKAFSEAFSNDKEKDAKKKSGMSLAIDSTKTWTNAIAFNPDELKNINNYVDNVKKISENLNNIQTVDASAIPSKIEPIKQSIDKVKGMFKKSDLKGLGRDNLDKATSAVTAINEIANMLLAIPGNIDFNATNNTIDNVIKAVKKLSVADENGDSFKSVVDKLGKDAINTESAITAVTSINTLASTLASLQDFDESIISGIIQKVSNALISFTNEGGISMALARMAQSHLAEMTVTAKTIVDNVTNLGNSLLAIPDVGNVQERISVIINALKEIAGLQIPPETEGMITTIQSIITQLAGLTVQFNALGGQYATNLATGFNNGDFSLFNLKVDNIINTLNNKADLTAVGKKMSDTLATGFDSTAMITEISAIQTAIDNLKGKTIEIKVKRVEETVERANGGLIPEYHSTGGRVGSNQFKHGGMGTPKGLFKQIGTDTVPAMLTAGEYVIKRSVARALGTGFLDALNNMSLNVAYSRLANRLGGGNVVNNTYNNITQNVDNKASFVNGLGRIKRVVRT